MIRAIGFLIIGLVLGMAVYVALIWAGLVRDPLWPNINGDLALARSNRPGIRVLFVGNSLTYTNSMPALVEQLAGGDPGAQPVIAVWYTAGGWRLQAAAGDGGLKQLLPEAHWDDVVLQEQSQRASSEALMYPAAATLATRIRAVGARPMLFMTWGWRDGDGSDVNGDTYAAMQTRVIDAYSEVGRRLSAPVAPVGIAWQDTLRRDPGLDLWASDGVHPTRAGSYLAACVFYVMLTGHDPEQSSFTAGIDPGQARLLQRVAWVTAGPVTPVR